MHHQIDFNKEKRAGGALKKIFILLIRGYQKGISPMFPASCRYQPTCSQYTIEAIQQHGALKGTVMGTARIMRCHPFVKGGYDPVPDHFSLKRNQKKRSQNE